MKRSSMLAVAVAMTVAVGGPTARGGPLNPLDFTSLGAFPSAVGTYLINTTGTPKLTGPGGTVLATGVVSDGVAVFDFDSISVVSGESITGTGSLPVALLSRGAIAVNGVINVSGGPAFAPGSGAVSSGGGQGGYDSYYPGYPYDHLELFGGSGGGGGGGFGGAGKSVSFALPPYIPPLFASGGAGGSGYGSLLVQLQGGGSGGSGFIPGIPAYGGGGGGAIELGAIGNISVSGLILANGVYGSGYGAGGGGGGSILLHGDGVTLTGLLAAGGGSGGLGGGISIGMASITVGGGGGGGGGRVVIDPGSCGFADIGGKINVSGGAGSSSNNGGTAGVLMIVPEPASIVLLALAVPIVAPALRRPRPPTPSSSTSPTNWRLVLPCRSCPPISRGRTSTTEWERGHS